MREAGTLTFPQELARFHDALALEPGQEAAWEQVAMTDREASARKCQGESAQDGAEAIDREARHALLFSIALSEFDDLLSGRRAAIFQEEVARIGSALICASNRDAPDSGAAGTAR